MTIKEQVKEIISYSQGILNPHIDTLMENWEKNKAWFIEKNAGNLIYEFPEPVCFHLEEKDKINRVSEFCQALEFKGLFDLAEFIYDNQKGFFDNVVLDNYYTKNDILVPKGSKLLRAFKYFITNKDLLSDLQNQASMIIQENKIEGKLCISVHPLDYLSSSENTYHWRSCHALDGEYRAGNLSYMADSSTIICYLKGEEEAILPNFPETIKWNSKKWRMLINISDAKTLVCFGRQYPMFSKAPMKKILDALIEKDIVKFASWDGPIQAKITTMPVDNGDDWGLVKKYMYTNGYLRPVDEVIKDYQEEPLHYNDLLYSSCYDFYYAYAWNSEGLEEKVNVGHPVACVACGNADIERLEEGGMVCADCANHYDNDDFFYCDCCGSRWHRDDMSIVDDNWVCPDCFDDKCHNCAVCGQVHFENEMWFRAETNDYVCINCSPELQEKRRQEQEEFRRTLREIFRTEEGEE